MDRRRVIDVHAHFVLPEYRQMLERRGALTEDGFPLPDWSVEEHLALMDRAGIWWTLLSLSSPHPYFPGHDREGVELCRRLNEAAAEYKRTYPDRIGFSAVLPLPNVEAAVEEAVYALDVLGADGVKLASNSRGQYLGEKSLEPLFAELDRRGAVVNIHPHRPEPLREGIFSAGPVPLFEFLCDTTRAVLNLIAGGTLERFPHVRVVVPHCGSFLPNIFDRFSGIARILVPRGLMEPVDVKAAFDRLWFDLSGSPSPALLKLLLTAARPEHILYGGDFPFTPAPQVERGLEELIALLEKDPELAPYEDMILSGNARELYRLP